MKLGDVIKKIKRFEECNEKGKVFVHYAIKHGWVKPKKIQKAKISRWEFSEIDMEKIKQLSEMVLGEELSWPAANAKAEAILREKHRPKDKDEIRMMLIGKDGKPIKGEKFILPGLDIGLETGSDGLVETIAFPPATLIRDPFFEQMPNSYKELVQFVEGWTNKGFISAKTLDAIKYQVDQYAYWVDKNHLQRKRVFESINGGVIKRIGELCEKKDPDIEVIPEDIFKEISENLKDFSLDEIKLQKSIKGISPENLHTDPATAPLFFTGFYGRREYKIRLGYTIQEEAEKKLPGSIVIALKNLDNLVEANYLRKLFMEQINQQYHLSGISERYLGSTQPPVEEVEEFIRRIRETLVYLRKKFEEDYIPVQDSFAFYDQGQSLYTPLSGEIFIFATSSGIVIPEEYTGDIAQKKNPYRRKYFDRGIAGKPAWELPKFYQWDANETALQLWKNFQKCPEEVRNLYKERAIDLLASFFQVPNLEITEIDFTNSPWKLHFTLVSHQGILFSVRKTEIKKKISHGILAGVNAIRNRKVIESFAKSLKTPERKLQAFDDCCDIVRELYNKESHIVIKGRGQTFSRPKDMARDVIENLLEKGSKISGKLDI